MNEIKIFENSELGFKVRTLLNPDGSISVNAEDTAIGYGWTQEKNGKTYLYVLNELDITISVYCNGNLCQTISLEENLPEGVLAAELCIAEGKMLYASVRGTGEIFGFTIEENGMLSLKQKVVVPEGWFRSICLDSSEKHLLAADQKTGKIYIFDRQSEGELGNQRVLVEVPVPVQVLSGKIE